VGWRESPEQQQQLRHVKEGSSAAAAAAEDTTNDTMTTRTRVEGQRRCTGEAMEQKKQHDTDGRMIKTRVKDWHATKYLAHAMIGLAHTRKKCQKEEHKNVPHALDFTRVRYPFKRNKNVYRTHTAHFLLIDESNAKNDKNIKKRTR
jgi:hypothetical protein